MTQIGIAVCICLLLACLKFASKIGCSLQQILRLLRLNLFEQCNFHENLWGSSDFFLL